MQTAGVLGIDPPSLTSAEAEEIVRTTFGIRGGASPLVSERDQNFRITDPADPAAPGWVLKVSNAGEEPEVIEMEVAAVEHVARIDPSLPVPVARPTLAGGPIGLISGANGVAHRVRLLPALRGRNADATELDERSIEGIGVTVARLGRALRGFFHPAAGRTIWWDLKHIPAMREHHALVDEPERRALLGRALHRYDERLQPVYATLRAQVIHDDATLDNLLLDQSGRVTGIIDFGDMAHTALVADISATLQSLLRGREDIFEVAEAFLRGYTSVTPLEQIEADLLGDLLSARMVQTILISVWRTRQYPDNAYITGWTDPAWRLLEQLEAVGVDEAGRRLATAARPGGPFVPGWSAAGTAELIERRSRVLGSALSPLTYRRPLHLVRGERSWLFDTDGRGYLDAYNNVPVVGHSHPRVVEAIARQAATLNTNTRYLHEAAIELAERLVATMPEGLDTVMFVNSGSEATDLAWRLATIVSGATGGIVSDWAYHGVSAAIADLSPSEWPRGEQPAHVETFPPPDAYRGIYRDLPDPGARAAAELDGAVARLAERGHRPAALYLDTLFTSDGIFAPGPLHLAPMLARARAAGALLVADEVQAGHGRGGDGLWSFSAWGVTPDIVTLGKPMGNGHPIAAVITRADIVDRFAAETEFFSTFGGNPVACAAGLAVLDVLEEERLLENSQEVGERLRASLAELAARHRAIGDIRGRGLMTGVELTVDRATREPAGDLATRVRDEMRERGVLIGTTGRQGNVLKIRPPLCATHEEADLIVETLDQVLAAAGG
ncbi:MAG: aminotransferase class III-fold pyridoxal phosphate-dependent enzyme [Chloroflexota bacterium]|nr:aminotransferase class III-fold pyridoxal phosphate-dependent enzyme [Chloroflexota bacterium]